MQLLTAPASDQGAQVAQWSQPRMRWFGGPGTLYLRGTVDGCTVALYMAEAETSILSPKDGEALAAAKMIAVTSATLSAEGQVNFDIGACWIQLLLSSPGANTRVSAGVLVRKPTP